MEKLRKQNSMMRIVGVLLMMGIVVNLLSPAHLHLHHHHDSGEVHQSHSVDLHLLGDGHHDEHNTDVIDLNHQGIAKKVSKVSLSLVLFMAFLMLVPLVRSHILIPAVSKIQDRLQPTFLISPPLRAPPLS